MSFLKEGTVKLTKNVQVSQGGFVLNADSAVIFLDEQKNVTKVEATGKVRAKKEEKGSKPMHARGNYAEFQAVANTLTLIGDAFLSTGSDEVRGTKIIYEMATEKVAVERPKGQMQNP